METDINGVIKALRIDKKRWSLAVIEAVVNSIQAIEDRKKIEDQESYVGKISIEIDRDTIQPSASDEVTGLRKPIAVRVSDNGIGLDEDHFKAFTKAHTSFRKAGRGIGRFYYLKYFRQCKIESTTKVGDEYTTTSYDFNEISDVKETSRESSQIKDSGTTISMSMPVSNDLYLLSPTTIFNHLIDHCIVPHIKKQLPDITIVDEQDETTIVVNNELTNQIEEDVEGLSFNLFDHEIKIHLRKHYEVKAAHELKMCTADRVVYSRQLNTIRSGFHSPFVDSSGKSYYVKAYVESDLLDENVDELRTQFIFLNSENQNAAFSGPTEDSIIKEVMSRIVTAFQNEVDSDASNRMASVKTRVLKDAPEYGYLTSGEGYAALINVRHDADEVSFKQDLVKCDAEWSHKHFGKVKSLLPENITADTKEQYLKDLHEFFEQEGSYAISKLAQYIMHRNIILKIIKQFINYGRDGNAISEVLEKGIHDIIMPMGTTNVDDDKRFMSHNLWLLDERLVTYQYFNSDKRLDQSKGVGAASGREPDLLGYSFRFSDSVESGKSSGVVIVEIKRPGLGYVENDKGERPDEQIVNYIDLIITKQLKKDGTLRGLSVEDRTPKYAYVICDITSSEKSNLIRLHQFKEAVDGTLFKPHHELNLYISILNYDQFLGEAEKRNRVLFERLGITGTSI